MSGNWNHQRSNNNSRQHNGHQFSGRAAVNNGSGFHPLANLPSNSRS